ncbi:hypothetical protein RHS02_09987, partial [Rhizoctonia solani]
MGHYSIGSDGHHRPMRASVVTELIEQRGGVPACEIKDQFGLDGVICDLVSRHDNARLLCVCRQLSMDIRPFVWTHTDAVEVLIGMIPESRIETYVNEPFAPYRTMYLPRSLDLSRLGVYSPYITRLDIPLTMLVNRYENWNGFLSSLVAQEVDLLPNLEHLRIALSRDTRGERIPSEAFHWAVAFMSSSLLSFQVYPDVEWDTDSKYFSHAWVGLDMATYLLLVLSKKCLKLSSLNFLPGNIKLKVEGVLTHPRLGYFAEKVPVLAKFWAPLQKIHLMIPRFQCLRSLSATPYILEPATFVALSKLPCLESLSIRDVQLDSDWQVYCYKLGSELTEQSFPALRYLDLIEIVYDTLIHICSQRPLARALYNLKPAIIWSDVRRNQLAHLLGLLAKYRSPVKRLCLAHIPLNWGLLPHSMTYLSFLKLTHLSVPRPNGLNYEMAQLAHAAPGLESLEFNQWMCSSDFELNELRFIATLWPNLQQLSLPIASSSAERLEELEPTFRGPHSLKPFYLESYFYDEEEDLGEPIPTGQNPLAKHVDKIARYLHTLWPTVECKAKRFPPYFEDLTDLNNLNDCISRLRSQPPVS